MYSDTSYISLHLPQKIADFTAQTEQGFIPLPIYEFVMEAVVPSLNLNDLEFRRDAINLIDNENFLIRQFYPQYNVEGLRSRSKPPTEVFKTLITGCWKLSLEKASTFIDKHKVLLKAGQRYPQRLITLTGLLSCIETLLSPQSDINTFPPFFRVAIILIF